MAKIIRYLSAVKDSDGKCEIYLRATFSRELRFKLHSGLKIDPKWFDNGTIKKPRMVNDEHLALKRLEQQIGEIESLILETAANNDNVTKEDIDKAIFAHHHPKRQYKKRTAKVQKTGFFALWDDFMREKDISDHWSKQYQSLVRALHRYEKWTQATSSARYTISGASFDPNDFTRFYRSEPDICDKHPDIYAEYPTDLRPQRNTHRPQARGDNMIADIVKKLRAFFNWCVRKGHMTSNPMDAYIGVTTERYGTPVYLTKEERDIIAAYDLSARPQLAKQRDVFVFQCHIGCRVGDLYSMDRSNIVGDAIEYIPGKTKKDRMDTVRVPLTATAKAIIDRYKEDPKMLPLISQQKYNEAIKEVCRVCGIDRIVTIINPTTGQDERKPIWEVASSHMARRTFIGNLYKKVKDPNLVGALSGHKEGSRAFVRYREIDDDIRRELIDLVE